VEETSAAASISAVDSVVTNDQENIAPTQSMNVAVVDDEIPATASVDIVTKVSPVKLAESKPEQHESTAAVKEKIESENMPVKQSKEVEEAKALEKRKLDEMRMEKLRQILI
jgi:hypothetical protein